MYLFTIISLVVSEDKMYVVVLSTSVVAMLLWFLFCDFFVKFDLLLSYLCMYKNDEECRMRYANWKGCWKSWGCGCKKM